MLKRHISISLVIFGFVYLAVAGACFAIRGDLIRAARKSSKAGIFEQTEAASIEMFSPKDDWNVTDFAVCFRWERVCEPSSEMTTTKYQLQVANNPSFDSPVIDVYQDAPIDVEGFWEDVPVFDYWTEMMYMPPELLSTGVWYWRVRVADTPGEPWSGIVRFTVNNDHSKWPLVRSISDTNPLFIFDMYLGEYQEITDKWDVYYNFFPSEVQNYIVFAIDRNFVGFPPAMGGFDGHFEEFMEPLAQYNIQAFVKTGGPDIDFQVYADLTELEHAFQRYPNILGITTGENLWGFLEASGNPDSKKRDTQILWLKRVIELCNKYGRYVIFGEHNFEDFSMERYLGEEKPAKGDFEWMSPELIRESNLIFCPKTNTFWGHYHSDSIIFGAWLSGLIKNQGYWAEAWYWNDAGYKKLFDEQQKYNGGDMHSMPINFWFQQMLLGLSKGATVYNFGGESSVTEEGVYYPKQDKFCEWFGCFYSSAFWDRFGNKASAVDKYLVPFIKAVVEHNMIPIKDEVMQQVKVAVVPGAVEDDKGNAMAYGDYATMYLNTYGIREYVPAHPDLEPGEYNEVQHTGCRYEVIPNSGRYYWIPILPHPAEDIGGSSIEVVKLSELQDETYVQGLFQGKYPERYSGDAWVTLVGNKIFIMNTHENEDVTETYDIALDGDGGITNVSGSILPHHYIMGRRGDSDDSFWFQANLQENRTGGYTDGRTTEIVFTCKRKPQVTVTPTSALNIQEWNGSTHELSLSLNHTNGAVGVQLIVGTKGPSI